MNYLLTLSQRVKIITYLFSLAKRQKLQKDYCLIRETTDDLSQDSLEDILNATIEILDEDSQRIIINDFREKTNKYWWQSFYSRSTYYRLKTKATTDFLNCLHGQ